MAAFVSSQGTAVFCCYQK